MAKAIPGDDRSPFRLGGMKVWVNDEMSLAHWVEAPGGYFLAACPECRYTFWYRPGDVSERADWCEHFLAKVPAPEVP